MEFTGANGRHVVPDDQVERIADAFNVPPHIVGFGKPHRWTWRLRRWARMRRRASR